MTPEEIFNEYTTMDANVPPTVDVDISTVPESHLENLVEMYTDGGTANNYPMSDPQRSALFQTLSKSGLVVEKHYLYILTEKGVRASEEVLRQEYRTDDLVYDSELLFVSDGYRLEDGYIVGNGKHVEQLEGNLTIPVSKFVSLFNWE